MKTFQWSTYLLALTVALHAAGASYGQGKDVEEKGEIQIGRHSAELTAGELYLIKVEGNGFMPQVNVNPGYLNYSNSVDFNNRNKFSASYVPKQTQKHTFSVLPQLFGEPATGAKLSYTFSVKRVVLSEKPVLKVATKLDKDDPRYERNFRKAFHKVFPLAVKSGEFYVIEMIHKRGAGLFRQPGDLDPYLILEDEATKLLASDDDSAGELNSRLVYQATKDGQFQLIATSLGDNQFGEFTLTIRSSEKK